MSGVDIEMIQEAAETISGDIHHTGLFSSETVSSRCGNRIFLKAENLQKTGSFKIRGALNRIYNLNPKQRERGVLAVSAGNHAQGVAYGAARAGIESTIIMPEAAPIAKVMASRSYGARVELHGDNFDESRKWAEEVQKTTGAYFIHPFDDPYVIAGQGTIAFEILEDLPDVDCVVIPVGGGGLIAGMAVALKELRPDVEVIGVEAARAASMKPSFERGRILDTETGNTLADGIAVSRPGEMTFRLIREYVDGLVTVSEREIARAILLLLERGKLIVEGAGAAPVAALLHGKIDLEGKTIAALLSGGNIDVNVLAQIIERGLVNTGRRIRLKTEIEDKPGQLSRLLGIIADSGANVISIYHNRLNTGVEFGLAEVVLDLETRNEDHSHEVIEELIDRGYRITLES